MTDPLIPQLIEARLKAGLRQVDVAAAMGIEQCYLSQLERGAKSPTFKTVRRWAQALGLQPTLVPLAYDGDPASRIAQAIRDEAKHYPATEECEDRCLTDEDACMEANIHQAWSVNGVIGAVYASPERIAEVVVAALGLPQTAPAEVSDVVSAGNGASPEGGRHVPSAAPASDPADVGSDEGRADVALISTPGKPVFEGYRDLADVPPTLNPHAVRERLGFPCNCLDEAPGPCNCLEGAVARTLDVAEATADKARAVGLARETAS